MDMLNLENIIKNTLLKEKLEIILNNRTDNKKEYMACVTLLEFINIKLLRDHLKIEMPDYNIIRIIEKYANVDEALFNFMLGINDTYNTIDMNNIEDDDVESLLYDIDFMYGHILEKYGDIIK